LIINGLETYFIIALTTTIKQEAKIKNT